MQSRAFVLAVAASMSVAGIASADIVTQWNFPAVVAPPINSPVPDIGSGASITLGMNNAFNGGNTAADDIVSSPSAAVPAFSENTWRIRGSTHNGWATHAAGAPQYSQGSELDSNTTGFSNISFSFDWYCTNQGIRDLQVQYNLDTTSPVGWTNIGGTSPTGTYIAVPNDFYGAGGAISHTPISVDFSSLLAANNDANFGVRLVAAFDSTGHVPSDFASATLLTGATQLYNNSSGNWRFGNLTFSGTTPAPSSASLLGLGGLLASRRRRA